jgi:hypothetical protein
MGLSISGSLRREAGRSDVDASMVALAAIDHRHLDLVRQNGEVTGKAIGHRMLGFVRRKVADAGAFGGVLRNFSICA